MPAIRQLVRSLSAALATVLFLAAASTAQEASVQKLLERGAFTEAVQRAEAERGNPESTFFAAQALIKTDDNARAAEEFGRLREANEEDWKAIGESGATLLAGDAAAAMAAATRAVEANPDNPYAHYQVGAAASRQNDFNRAAEAFAHATQLKADFAYAHYYAGLANQRVKQTAKMAEHFDAFLRLAPEAPERGAVASILRTLRRF